MKVIDVADAVGSVLCHDITRIIPGEFKGRAFRRGHVVRPEDIPTLLNLGKEHLYVYDLAEGYVHEDDAAHRMALALAQDTDASNLTLTAPCEGRINLVAACDGLLQVDVDGLFDINSEEQLVVATAHTGQAVQTGRMVAGCRVVPLAVRREKLERMEALCAARGATVSVLPFRPLKVGVVTTGSEVYHGRIKDKFGPILKRKFSALNCTVMGQTIVSDDKAMAVSAIRAFLDQGAEMVAVTGGMSVDPDDQTPAAIRALGGEIVTYGAPTFPGAMFMLAYVEGVPVVGLPGCVMYAQASVFDLVTPRLVAGLHVTRKDIVAMGHGGLCMNCPECRHPVCPFGK
ncbi:molybdopterin-binding protein [Megalodesulfovibrio gigas]|uniref:Molybdopterin molybdenumtransferase n=1 Tax=Megalodesulfovibrio gigas (strain ATCC 19364 / DSM 1382 / NCIMB 9332 / VKM B-1759) TaxID=1121448 RepID=T2GA52_MEGG1|nr:molybdopterin-binding protein [Megalodesulfovibrio gigas]AGW12792.1 putative molybdopterin biosynthesis enzyme [Megalodesulfovibrio gigas DSM 1382 = ATCC 19364]